MKIKLLTAAALSLFAPLLASAQNADLTMSGAIVPGACTTTISSGGVINIGRHSASTLNAAAQTLLPMSDEVSLTVNCDAAVAMLISIVDNQSSTAVNTLSFPDFTIAEPTQKFGLGASGGTNIGMYGVVEVPGATVDGVAVIRLLNGGLNPDGWRDAFRFDNRYLNSQLRSRYTLGNLDGGGVIGVPASGRIANFPFKVLPIIRNGDDLNLTGEIPLSGSLTFTVTYM